MDLGNEDVPGWRTALDLHKSEEKLKAWTDEKTEDTWMVDVNKLESVFHHVGEKEREGPGLPATEESILGN